MLQEFDCSTIYQKEEWRSQTGLWALRMTKRPEEKINKMNIILATFNQTMLILAAVHTKVLHQVD